MTLYRYKEIFYGIQWNKLGDHPAVELYGDRNVDRRSHPEGICEDCEKPFGEHGWIKNERAFYGGWVICPGWYVTTTAEGEHKTWSESRFKETFEEVD